MKRYSPVVVLAAKDLRSRGYTYSEIYDYLGEIIPKSTLNGWVRHIITPDSYQSKLKRISQEHLNKVRTLALAKNKTLLETRLCQLRDKHKHLVPGIDRNVSVIILSTLYWCEGTKYPSHRNLQFGNSDPGMIKLFIKLLRSCFEIDESKFRLAVQCRADQDQEELTVFWEKITNISRSQHYKPRVDPRSIGKPTKKLAYKGVCVIDYMDSSLQCELQFFGTYLGSDEAMKHMKKQLK